jgi:hypothetical protein
MKYLLEIADATANKKTGDYVERIKKEHEHEIDDEVSKLSDKDIDDIVGHLFPTGIPVSSDFYDCLKEFQHYVGYGPNYYTLGGCIWARACSGLAPDKQKELLNSLIDEKGRGIWRAIFYLPEFCSRVEIESQFAAEWFYRFGDKVKDDMANWDFFNGVKNYALHFPASGMKVFEKYLSENLDHLKITLAALLLGTIRSQATQGYFDKTVVDHWDKQLSTSSKIEKRLVYYKSLPTSFDIGTLSKQKIECELAKMLSDEPEEISEAFLIVWRCLRSERADDDFMKFAMKWFSENSSDKLPDWAKYHIVNAMWFFNMTGNQKKDIIASEADNLLIAIQPIPESNRGTWEYLERYLTERLRQEPASFENILGRFVEANPKGMFVQFQSEMFDDLKSEIYKVEAKDFVTRWSLSTDENKREIARAILQKSKSIVLSQKIISEANEKQLEIALLEFIRKPLIIAEKTSEYLLALEPAFRNVRPELKQMFKNEMILQAINYPGACLNNWKKIENLSDLLKEVISNAEKYFEKLNAIKDSPAVAFTFPGCKEAAEREAREFSNKVSKEAIEKSIFAKLVKNTQIIYGSRWAVMMVDGKLGQATNFNEFGHSMEFPRLEIIDPEGMAIRRMHVTSDIERIESGR